MAVTVETEPVEAQPVEVKPNRPRRSWWTIAAIAVCVLVGCLSVLTRSWVPSYDVFSWIVWGRELAHHIIGPHEPFVAQGASSWKPFPVIFTTIFGFFGGAVKLWVAFARALGLIGFVLAYRVAYQLGRSEEWSWSGPVAGILAAFAIFLTAKWTHFMLRGTSEPIVVTATLLAVDLHLAGRRVLAFWAGVALALMRPEASVFVGLYGLWLFWVTPSTWVRGMLIIGVLVIAAGWTVPTWLSSHDPFLASNHARSYNGHLNGRPIKTVLDRATNLTVWPVIVAAGVAVALAIYRRNWLIVVLAAGSLGYVVVVAAMAVDHYPGLERFMLPAAAVASVLAAVGVVWVAALARGGVRSPVLVVALVAIGVPFFIGRITSQHNEVPRSELATVFYHQMISEVHQDGGAERMLPCISSRLGINHSIQPELAYVMKVPLNKIKPLTRFHKSMRRPLLFLKAPYNIDNGGSPRQPYEHNLHGTLIRRMDRWRLIRVTKPGDTTQNACVGT